MRRRAFDRGAPPIRQWLRRNVTSPTATTYNVVVDLDLEKFFDRVNHDSLMARVAARVSDKRVLKLIRAFLKKTVWSVRWMRGRRRAARFRPS